MDYDEWRRQLARRVKALREARGLRQEDLENSGVSAHTVQAIEYGDTDPRASTLFRLAEGLGVTMAELVGAKRRE